MQAIGWLPECRRVARASRQSGRIRILEMRGTYMCRCRREAASLSVVASGTVRLCHSATRLVRVCLIISCLASRAHRVSMTKVWRAPLILEPKGRHFLMHIIVIMKKCFTCHAVWHSRRASRIKEQRAFGFAHPASYEARAPFAGSSPGI